MDLQCHPLSSVHDTDPAGDKYGSIFSSGGNGSSDKCTPTPAIAGAIPNSHCFNRGYNAFAVSGKTANENDRSAFGSIPSRFQTPSIFSFATIGCSTFNPA